MHVETELDRQRDVLLARGYPEALGTDARTLVAALEPLRAVVVAALGPEVAEPSPAAVPFVLVVAGAWARADDLVPLMTSVGDGRRGILDRNHGPEGLAPYQPLPELGVPDALAYALLGVERGEEYRDVPPRDAVAAVRGRGRTPLTVHEGIALVATNPQVLEPNHCFMLAGSRRGDRRVPAIWISEKAPKLGWCWEGNPHSWLGTASARSRVWAESSP